MLGALLRALAVVGQWLTGSKASGREHAPSPTSPAVGEEPTHEARSLNDLLRIRAANRLSIEAVNGNLGTALGFKWSDGKRTDHPCVIIFVPQKTDPWLVPEAQRAPAKLEAPDGTWCLTDVVTGGKAASLEEFDPLPGLSPENKIVVKELRSGRVGLIGGIQLSVYGGGVEDADHAFVGTAGMAAIDTESGKVGLLTNQHVADEPGRVIYHPWHRFYRIGVTAETKVHAADEKWYGGVIDEADSYVRCDCAFVAVDEQLLEHVKPGLHAVGDAGPLLRTDPDTMDLIGQRVTSVGRTRGVQRGTVVAYAYEHRDGPESVYTDLLIIGKEGEVFSDKGDSGKVIVTDDDLAAPSHFCGEAGKSGFGTDVSRRTGHTLSIWARYWTL